ncbi:NAD-dependent epimerase/dehydratase family protein [Nocardia altamirensis]|uniref:NAD-dependent epimerase/dehydratase family protein n=1 Tax=Nocardia altamirensis TaxID=472158 RepID=UPI0008405738|nr:NAD-dependent epimerase/dehydratase family protein [Nocardia altamirensis]
MSVLVLGGYGAVGTHLMSLLRAAETPALTAGRNATRADRVVDLSDIGSFEAALDSVTAVVNCAGAEDIRLAETCAGRGIPFLDISATTDYVAALEKIGGPVVLGVGLAPGLTTLLAVDVLSAQPGPVDILIGLGAGEHHGPAATAWTYGLLGQHFPDPDGTAVRNFTKPARFDVPAQSGYRSGRALRADFADQHRLTREFGVPVRAYLRTDSRIGTAGLALLTRAPALRSLIPPRMPGSDRWILLARATDGSARWAYGRGQSKATAVVTAATVHAVLNHHPTDPTWIHQLLTLADVRDTLHDNEIELGDRR